jgi:MoxR-like ATPase
MSAQPLHAAILPERLRESLAAAVAQINALVLGKPREVDLAFTALLAGGHLLIEDLPGLGKTTQLLLADEINRAPPRTQSALLEAMAEHQVTVDGITHNLPQPFFVMATQNPADLAGTFPLPDSQLDRFLLRLRLGYPEAAAEREMLSGADRRQLIGRAVPQLSGAEVLQLRESVARVHASEALVTYVQALLGESRRHRGVRVGLSPRAGLALLQGARAHALIAGRTHALPEDVQALFVEVAAHRLVPEAESSTRDALAASILSAVAVD